MKNLNLIRKVLSKDTKKITPQKPSRLFAEFFNGIVIELEEENAYDT